MAKRGKNREKIRPRKSSLPLSFTVFTDSIISLEIQKRMTE